MEGYRYNGKEWEEDIGLYAYGFRYYDPAIGRFTGVDPIADKFAHVSVYNYAENEPIAHIDLHGLQKYTPKIQQINGPGDLFSMKMINNAKEGLKTIAIEFFETFRPEQVTPSREDFHDSSGSYEGSGVTILSNSGLKTQGILGTPEAKEGSTVILETDEISIMMPADAGGALGDAAAKTPLNNALFFLGKRQEEVNNFQEATGANTRSEVVDTVCAGCNEGENLPHFDIPVIRIGKSGNTVDTIKLDK